MRILTNLSLPETVKRTVLKPQSLGHVATSSILKTLGNTAPCFWRPYYINKASSSKTDHYEENACLNIKWKISKTNAYILLAAFASISLRQKNRVNLEKLLKKCWWNWHQWSEHWQFDLVWINTFKFQNLSFRFIKACSRKIRNNSWNP